MKIAGGRVKGEGYRVKQMEERFKKLIVWQKAYKFSLEIYTITKKFPKYEQFGLTSQIRRSSISIFANIAEGYERNSRKEYIHFLTISRGSLGEVESYLLFANDLVYITKDEFNKLEEQRQEIAKLLKGLISSLI